MARLSNKSIAEILTPSATEVSASKNNGNDGLSLLERKINIATEGFTRHKFCELVLRDRNMLSIILGIDFEMTLGEKKLEIELTPLLDRLHSDGML